MKGFRRLAVSIITGALAGAVIAALIALPVFLGRLETARAASIRQNNLTPARGEAYDAVPFVDVTVFAGESGVPDADISVSADGASWYIPKNGAVTLALAPGRYDFRAARDNRVVTIEYDVRADADNTLVLNTGNAPSAPELVILDAIMGADALLPLDIAGADDVAADGLPNGMTLARSGGGFALALDGGILDCGFYPVTLTASNEYGQTTAHVGLRIPRGGEPIPISTADELRNIRRSLSASYIIIKDIDMSGVHDWSPPGTLEYPFTGVIDGSGHEITGFHAPERITEDDAVSMGGSFSLLGSVKNAEVRNIIVREPNITPEVPAREGNIVFGCFVLAGNVTNSLIENCATIGGLVSPSDNYAGGLCALGGSIALRLFSSTDVICNAPNRYLPNTGGLFSAVGEHSYAAYCANEGDVFGRHLTGGITGYNHSSEIVRCVNSGYIWGSTLVGEFPPGGIMQTTDFGAARYCYFVKGKSAAGGRTFAPGVLGIMSPIDASDLRNRAALTLLGTFGGDNPDWCFASLDANGPVPYGIFKRQTERPDVRISGDTVTLPAIDGVRYFYTFGGDPYTGVAIETGGGTISLDKNQTLTVYAARQGFRDSEIVIVSTGEGR